MSNERAPMLRVLSLGWGVQTWALAVMIAQGDIPPVDYMVFANTTHESESTYRFSEEWGPWLTEQGQRLVSVKSKHTAIVEQWNSGTQGVMIPAFTFSREGNKGQIRRQCTGEWKIAPIRRFVSDELARRGIPKRAGVVETLLGISTDEFTRMKDSDVKYITHSYPLVDFRMSRQDCITYVTNLGLPVPPKSSCVFCPYHNKAAWDDLRKRGGEDWQEALRGDETIRNKRDTFKLFIHPSRKPLVEAVKDTGQMELLWPDGDCDSGFCFT